MAQPIQASDLCIVCNTANLAKRKYRYNPARKPKKCAVTSGTHKHRQRLEEEYLIIPQLRPLFLLKEIFKRPMENASDLLKRMGNPTEWFDICGPCSNRIDQGIETQQKLKRLEERLKKLKEGICEKLYTSHLQEIHLLNWEVETPDVEEERSAFRNEIRRMIPSITEGFAFATTPTITEESSMSMPTKQSDPVVKTEVIDTETEFMEHDGDDNDDEPYFEPDSVVESGCVSEPETPARRWSTFLTVESELMNPDPVTALETEQLPHAADKRDVEPIVVKEETPDTDDIHHDEPLPSLSSDSRPSMKPKKILPPRRILPQRVKPIEIIQKKAPRKQKYKRKPYYYVPITTEVKKPDTPSSSESQEILAFGRARRKSARKSIGNEDEARDPTYMPGQPLLRNRKSEKRCYKRFFEDENKDELDEDYKVPGDEEEEDDDESRYSKARKLVQKISKNARLNRYIKRAKSRIRTGPKPITKQTANHPPRGWNRLLDCGHELLDMSLITYPPKTAEEKRKIPKEFAEISEVGVVHKEYGETSSNNIVTDHECPSCGKYFNHKYFAISHMHRFHLGIKRHWSCNKCSRKFVDARRLLKHLKLHDNGVILICPVCKALKSCSQKKFDYHVACHQKDVPNPTCNRCEKVYPDFNTYWRHMSAEHGLEYKNVHNKNKTTFICEHCSQTCKDSRAFKFHQVVNHGLVDEEGRFPICSHCSKQFISAQSLELHIQKDHIKAKNFFCDQCGLGFALEKQLKHHVNYVHSEVIPTTCNVCGLVVNNKRSVNKHMTMHHPEVANMTVDELDAHVKKLKESKPHKCSLCDKSFAFSVFLYHHYRNEHKEVTDKYKCDVCGKGYSRACSVKRHYETVHEKKTMRCQYCNKELPVASMYQHYQTRLCGAKKRAEEEARKFSAADSEKPTTSSIVTTKSEFDAPTPFFNPFGNNQQPTTSQMQQQFGNINHPAGMVHATHEDGRWEDVPINFSCVQSFLHHTN